MSPPAAPDDDALAADLARRVGRGDGDAERQLVLRYSRGVLFLLRRMTRDAALADDLHQETFRVVLERLRGGGLAEPEKLPAFLLATARNLYLGGYRKRVRRGEHLDLEPPESALDPAPGPLEEMLRAERRAMVRELIEELPSPRDREILLRVYVGEEEKERICADLKLSATHFNRVLFRARERLRQRLAQDEMNRRPTAAS